MATSQQFVGACDITFPAEVTLKVDGASSPLGSRLITCLMATRTSAGAEGAKVVVVKVEGLPLDRANMLLLKASFELAEYFGLDDDMRNYVSCYKLIHDYLSLKTKVNNTSYSALPEAKATKTTGLLSNEKIKRNDKIDEKALMASGVHVIRSHTVFTNVALDKNVYLTLEKALDKPFENTDLTDFLYQFISHALMKTEQLRLAVDSSQTCLKIGMTGVSIGNRGAKRGEASLDVFINSSNRGTAHLQGVSLSDKGRRSISMYTGATLDVAMIGQVALHSIERAKRLLRKETVGDIDYSHKQKEALRKKIGSKFHPRLGDLARSVLDETDPQKVKAGVSALLMAIDAFPSRTSISPIAMPHMCVLGAATGKLYEDRCDNAFIRSTISIQMSCSEVKGFVSDTAWREVICLSNHLALYADHGTHKVIMGKGITRQDIVYKGAKVFGNPQNYECGYTGNVMHFNFINFPRLVGNATDHQSTTAIIGMSDKLPGFALRALPTRALGGSGLDEAMNRLWADLKAADIDKLRNEIYKEGEREKMVINNIEHDTKGYFNSFKAQGVSDRETLVSLYEASTEVPKIEVRMTAQQFSEYEKKMMGKN